MKRKELKSTEAEIERVKKETQSYEAAVPCVFWWPALGKEKLFCIGCSDWKHVNHSDLSWLLAAKWIGPSERARQKVCRKKASH